MAKLVKCKACGNMIASDATSCPHCGSKNKRGMGCCSGGIVVIIVLVLIAYASANNKKNEFSNTSKSINKTSVVSGNAILEKRLAYLKSEVKELSRVEFIRNDVYISFNNNQLPDDYKIIANAAAFNGSKALVDARETVTRCSVWIIPVESKAGNVDKVFYNVNARNGKIY